MAESPSNIIGENYNGLLYSLINACQDSDTLFLQLSKLHEHLAEQGTDVNEFATLLRDILRTLAHQPEYKKLREQGNTVEAKRKELLTLLGARFIIDE